MSPSPDVGGGPTLETYVETRLNLLTVALRESAQAQSSALGSSIEATKESLMALDRVVSAAIAASDLRYEQRYNAQADALAAAFLSQQVAMKTALEAAKEAVQAALAAADRAVTKSEQAADKRFEALNELRQMLNDMVGSLITRVEAVQRFDSITEKIDAGVKRVESLEARYNTMTGEQSGSERRGRDVVTAARANVGMVVGIVGGGVGLILLVIAVLRFFSGR